MSNHCNALLWIYKLLNWFHDVDSIFYWSMAFTTQSVRVVSFSSNFKPWTRNSLHKEFADKSKCAELAADWAICSCQRVFFNHGSA